MNHTEPIQMQTQPTMPEQTVPAETVPAATEPRRLLSELQEPRDSDFVPVADYLPEMLVELKYATGDNLTGRPIYPFTDGYLRYGTVCKLQQVSRELAQHGLYLKLWDGFRPVSAQFALWEACPDPTYVANPNRGFSAHSRGNTVDITLVDENGREVKMPTGFDDFSRKADRDYSDCAEEEGDNARFLQSVMEKHGFTGYWGEWWHYSDSTSYPVEKVFDPSVIRRIRPDCREYITLRALPDITAEAITQIPVGEEMTLLGYDGLFSLVDFQGLRGYVLTEYTSEIR